MKSFLLMPTGNQRDFFVVHHNLAPLPTLVRSTAFRHMYNNLKMLLLPPICTKDLIWTQNKIPIIRFTQGHDSNA
jgi:hypothetical protein